MPPLPVPRLPPGGSLGTLKILGILLGPIRLRVDNWSTVPNFSHMKMRFNLRLRE